MNNSAKSNYLSGPEASAAVYSFVPAHGESPAGQIAHQLERILERREGNPVLLADFTSDRLEDGLEALYASKAIFLVAAADCISVLGVRRKMAWLCQMGLGGKCGVLLRTAEGEIAVTEFEELAGAPVCSLMDTGEQLERLGRWLAFESSAPGFSSDDSDFENWESEFALVGSKSTR